MMYLYSVRTKGGEKTKIVAHDPDEALRLLGLTRDVVRKWYPFPLAVVLPPEEQAEKDRKKAERFAHLQELNRQRRALRNGKGEAKHETPNP